MRKLGLEQVVNSFVDSNYSYFLFFLSMTFQLHSLKSYSLSSISFTEEGIERIFRAFSCSLALKVLASFRSYGEEGRDRTTKRLE